jgi:4-diphosphocytidyl-2-C-methyl-D-erythritol kinase
MQTRVRSFSKINLGLRIGPARPDGYHALCTLYQTLELHDVVTVSAQRASSTSITLDSNHPGVPKDKRNTAWRMVVATLERLGIAAEVEIHIQKNLPVQGGLGAGSANAVAALLGLERELGVALPGEERISIAGSIGSDVPLFLLGGTSIGLSRGEVVIPYPDLPPTPCVIAAPEVGVSTPAAFKEWDRRTAEEQSLTENPHFDRLEELSRIYASALSPAGNASSGASGVSVVDGDLAGNLLPALVRTGIANDFEEVVFQQHPSLRDILHALKGDEAVPEESRATMAMLSGSGSSLFGLYRTEADAQAAQRRVLEQGTRAIVTSTLPRSQYWSTMFQEQE